MSKKILSVFIDESGDFGSYEPHAPYYIVSMIFHNQSNNISEHIKLFDSHLLNLGYENHAIHTGPLIRRESTYSNDLIENRIHLFNSLFNFSRKLDFRYFCLKIQKRQCPDTLAIIAKIRKELENLFVAKEIFWKKKQNLILFPAPS